MQVGEEVGYLVAGHKLVAEFHGAAQQGAMAEGAHLVLGGNAGGDDFKRVLGDAEVELGAGDREIVEVGQEVDARVSPT